MNLRNVISGAVSSIVPQISVTVLVSSGYTVAADFSQVPAYDAPLATFGRIQPLDQKLYINGNFEGVFRVLGKGGDLIQFGGRTYLVSAVLERWAGWCSLALTMQVD
ncbi:hypothetical protein [Acidovorax sp. 16-64-162]|uniref:hypothetical protein n=1 Tax=Acidovorax sp. 16-64-162 TaxID=1970307 RepID=UPI0025C1D501|nr:hypothetical protein [Acidovorax sp. 16-64-162]